MKDRPQGPLLGLIMLDTQFPRIKGDIGNPETFDFPVIYQRVSGATAKRVVTEADPQLLEPFIEAARSLQARGATMISTSCGFLAMYQQELAAAVDIPVLTSSLLQLRSAVVMLQPSQQLGVMTISANSLTERHFSALGVSRCDFPIAGMPADSEFVSVFLGDKTELDKSTCSAEMVATAQRFKAENPQLGAIVLECTNMPPYANAIREATGLPVFDVVTLLNYANSGLFGCSGHRD